MQTTVTISKPKPHTGQVLVIQGFKRFNVIANGRRWGKTQLAIKLAMETMIAGSPVGYFVPTFDFAEEFWEEMKERLEPITIYKSESKMTLRLSTGGSLKVWSLEKKRAGRSRKYKRVIVDEAAFSKDLRESWERAIRPTLTDLSGDAFFLSSPVFGVYFQDLADNSRKYPNWATFQMATSTNPYISANELAEIKSQLDPYTWRQEFEAEFVNLTGKAFAYCFERDKHIVDYGVPKKNLPIYLSFDFNVDPITCIASQHAEDNSYIYTFVEFRLESSDIWKLCDAIKTKLDGFYFFVTGDASGKNRSAMTKDGMNYYTIIGNELDLVHQQFNVPTVNPLVKNSRILCNSMLYRHPKVMIHPRCEYLIKDIEFVQVKDNGDIDKDTNKSLTHLLDTWRYYLNTYFSDFIKLRSN